MLSPPRAATGTARLEFAFTVVVLGIVFSLALTHLAGLQRAAQDAMAATKAAQQRSLAALAEASELLQPGPTAVLSGLVSAFPSPSAPSNPRTNPQGVSP